MSDIKKDKDVIELTERLEGIIRRLAIELGFDNPFLGPSEVDHWLWDFQILRPEHKLWVLPQVLRYLLRDRISPNFKFNLRYALTLLNSPSVYHLICGPVLAQPENASADLSSGSIALSQPDREMAHAIIGFIRFSRTLLDLRGSDELLDRLALRQADEAEARLERCWVGKPGSTFDS